MLYNITAVQDALIGLVGWRKSRDPEAINNPMGDMLLSSTGIYFNDQHPLLTVKNIESVADSFDEYIYPAYDSGTTYDKGDLVTNLGNTYASVVDENLAQTVVDNAAYWRLTTPFNEWLRDKTLQAASKTINDWMAMKSDYGTVNSLLKNRQVLPIAGYKGVVETSPKKMVGFRVVPSPEVDVVITINRISLQLDQSEDCDVMLYKNGELEDTVTFLMDGSNDVFWKEVNWALERGNTYYIVYDTEALSVAQPINGIYAMDRDWSFNRFPYTLPYAEFSAFEHEGEGESGWEDVTDIQVNTTNHGLNVMFSANCNYTQLIVDQAEIFANAFAKATAIAIMQELAFNATASINRHESNIDSSRVLYEIDGDALGREGGLKTDYKKALKIISFDDRQLSRFCLPCRKNGVKIGVA